MNKSLKNKIDLSTVGFELSRIKDKFLRDIKKEFEREDNLILKINKN